MRSKKIQRDLLKLLRVLVKINTSYPPGDSNKFDRYIRYYLKKSKLKINSYYDKDKKKLNTVVKNYAGESKSLVFNSHIDTVKPIHEEWKTNPYSLKITNKYSYGLGAVNCKASAAVQLYIAKNLKKDFKNLKERICFTFVTSEENLGPEGTFYLRKKNLINPHTLILGAPTNNNFLIEERGVFWAKVTTKGKTSHAGEPEKGSNSIVNASKLILDLNTNYRNILKRFNSGIHKSTISIGIIKGGENINVVPFKTEILIDRRITSKENIKFSYTHLRAYLNKKFKNAKLEFLTGTNPFKSNPKNIYLLNLIKSYKKIKKNSPKFLSSIGVSDGRYFADDKINIINFGPGSGDEGHKSNEKLINKELLENYLILKDFLNKLN
jgi:acetylornithine deacetylase/succinyl-diaminopimelate desuccinylase family protein